MKKGWIVEIELFDHSLEGKGVKKQGPTVRHQVWGKIVKLTKTEVHLVQWRVITRDRLTAKENDEVARIVRAAIISVRRMGYFRDEVTSLSS